MKKRLLALILTVALLIGCALPALAADYDINTAKQSVVRIVTFWEINDPAYPNLKGARGYSTGTGFCIGKPEDPTVKYIVTAGHVVCRNAESGNTNVDTIDLRDEKTGAYFYPTVNVSEISVVLTDINGGTVTAHIAAAAEWTDLAVLELNTAIPNRKAAVMYDKRDKDFKLGEELTTMGFPSEAELNQSPTVSGDLLSRTDDVVTYRGSYSNWTGNSVTQLGDQISTDANMAPGISGGPLVDKDGYVVGVCRAVAGNTGYAIATDEVKKLLSRVTQADYVMGPLKKGLSTTMIIIIAAAAVVIIALIVLILVNSGKKSSRTLVVGGSMGGKVVPLKKGVPVVVGRDPNRCQIVYPKDAAGVSSVHCTITYDGNEVTVADNRSSYGTFVGGQKVEPGRPMVMHRGQEVTFGSDKNSAELH